MSAKRTRKSSPIKQLEKKIESINDLDDDCLLYIMKHTSFTDRLTLELVSKRWRSLSQKSWSDFKVLDFQSYRTKLAPLRQIEKVEPVLKRMMQRGGKFLVTIKFDDCISSKLGPKILTHVAQYCPNIEYLDAYHLNNVSANSLNALAKKCTKLTSFALSCRLIACQFALHLLLQENKSLKNLQLNILDDWMYTETIGRVLHNLNKEKAERISITNGEEKSLEGQCLMDVSFRDFSNLKLLELNGFYEMDHDVLHDIGSRCKSLDSLALAYSSVEENSNSMHEIGKLKNLTLLDVSWNDSVDDQLLTLIGANCQLLMILKISGCKSVTDTGMKNIVTLPNLKELAMAYLCVTDEGFEQSNMPNLLYLDCNSCGEIGDAALTRIVQTSEKLYFINLQECENVTDTFLNMFYSTSNKRKINCVLIQ